MSAAKGSRRMEPLYKRTDFRRELQYREKKVAEIKREQMKILADIRPVPRYAITIDLSHARGNLDPLKVCLKELEWKEYPFGRKDQHCDIHWHCINFEQNSNLYGGRVNKFPGMSWICSKMNLFRVLDQMKLLFPEDYDFYPRTWYLPEQLHEFTVEVRKLHEKKVKPKPTFIVKPDEGSQGDGIYLLRDPMEYIYNNGRIHVVQEYMSNVCVIDKFKFDLRIYVVLKSIDPLEFYICKEGLARFSTLPYESPTNRNMHETYMHLTNYSLNKRSSTFNRSERDDEGSKRSMSSVFNRLARMGYNIEKLWLSMEEMVVKTLIALLPDVKIELQAAVPPGKPGPSCFQILGFDILLLSNLKPILLEINASPSLRIDSEQEIAPGIMESVPSPKDEEVKLPLIRDTLIMMAPRNKLRYMESQKRRKAKLERRRQQREEYERHRQEREDARRLHQRHTTQNGVIHVETNHPRSSIIIIRADEDNQKGKQTETPGTNSPVKTAKTVDEETTVSSDQAEDEGQNDEVRDDNDNINQDDGSSDTGEQNSDDLEHGDNDNNPYDGYTGCLKQLYPEPYEEDYDKLRLYEKLSEVFMICRGIKSTQRLGPTGFRTFARKCRLNKRGVTNAAIDIMYIDMQRKWEHVNPERTTGLCFRGFLDACHEIARRKFYTENRLEMMDDFIDYCATNLREEQEFQAKNNPRLHTRRLRQRGFPVISPIPPPPGFAEDNPYIRQHSGNYVHPRCAEDVEAFLKLRRRRTYAAKSRIRHIFPENDRNGQNNDE